MYVIEWISTRIYKLYLFSQITEPKIKEWVFSHAHKVHVEWIPWRPSELRHTPRPSSSRVIDASSEARENAREEIRGKTPSTNFFTNTVDPYSGGCHKCLAIVTKFHLIAAPLVSLISYTSSQFWRQLPSLSSNPRTERSSETR